MSALPDLLRPLWVAGSGAGEVGTGDRQALDFQSPGDNLYAFGKLWAGYDEPVFSAFHGLMFGRMHSHKSCDGLTDIPVEVRAYVERHYPDYLEPCLDWDDGHPIGTWEAYARDVPPETG